MIVAVAPAGLTERQRGGVGGAAAGVIAPYITVPAASAGPGVAAPQVITATGGDSLVHIKQPCSRYLEQGSLEQDSSS